MKSSTRFQASSDSLAYCSWRRSKKECGAPGYVWISCGTRSRVPNSATISAVMFLSSPANRPSTGTVMSGERPGPGDVMAGRGVERPARALAPGRAVEADDAGQTMVARALHERLGAAEAEADGHDRGRTGSFEALHRGVHVGRHGVRGRLLDVRRIVEVLAARAEAGGAAEVVERDRAVAGVREALGQFLVEAEQPAHVGQHDDPHGACGTREVGREFGPIGRRERQRLARRAAGDHPVAGGDRGRDRVEGEAHAREITLRWWRVPSRLRSWCPVGPWRPSSSGTTAIAGRPGSTGSARWSRSTTSGRRWARG